MRLPTNQKQFTDRLKVMFKTDALGAGLSMLEQTSGIKATNSREVQSADEVPSLYYDQLDVAVISGEEDQLKRVREAQVGEQSVLAITRERYCWAIVSQTEVSCKADTDENTWGQIATNAKSSVYTGQGVKVAVLDSGIDRAHPVFAEYCATYPERVRSFVRGETEDDQTGHGTHCAGIIKGPRQSQKGYRGFGIAPNVELFLGKVLGPGGRGTDGDILKGLNWAARQQCDLVSLSVGGFPDGMFDTVFDLLAQKALSKGTLIMCAAGNESDRPSVVAPVSHPANCPHIMAVGAIDATKCIAKFSNGGLAANGGEVNVVAPGVDVFSSNLVTNGAYNLLDGTSMATPHAVGIAALIAEKTGKRGQALWDEVCLSCVNIGLSLEDAGVGLVQIT